MAILKSRFLRNGLAVVLGVFLMVAAYGFESALDYLFYPWAHSLTGQPTLTGDWKGLVNFEGRVSRPMILKLRRERHNSGSYPEEPTFDGTAQMPDELGNLIDYEVLGRSNRSGSEVLIRLSDKNRVPSPQKQPLLQELRGSWTGTTLTLSGKYRVHLFEGASSTTYSTDPVLSVTTVMTRQ